MQRKKIASEVNKDKVQRLKKIVTIIIFIGMLAVMACYGLGLDNYLHPKPQKSPEVSAWGENTDDADDDEDDGDFDFESAKENEGESGQNIDDSVIVTDPYKDTVTTEAVTEETAEINSENADTTEANTEAPAAQ